jgi:signal transduction histidine kinase
MKLNILSRLLIRGKLFLVAMTPCLIALLFACGAIAVYEITTFRSGMIEDLSSTAESVSYLLPAAVDFNNPSAASAALQPLQAHRHVFAAELYDNTGAVFAEYRSSGYHGKAPASSQVSPSSACRDWHEWGPDRLDVFHCVRHGKTYVGVLRIRTDLDELYARLTNYVEIAVTVMLVGMLVAVLLVSQLQTVISGPISNLAAVVAHVAKSGDFGARAVKQGDDELGQLTDGFNRLLAQTEASKRELQEERDFQELRVRERTAELSASNAQLEVRTQELQGEVAAREATNEDLQRAQKELMTASRQAGMAEVANNVLHNVGNVLNSVNVSATLLETHVKELGVARFARVVELFNAQGDNLGTFISTDPRGQKVPTLLNEIGKNFQGKEKTILDEIRSLQGNVGHIGEIVNWQQSLAKRAGVQEILPVTDLVEDSLRINAGALVRHGVELIREYQARPLVNLDKHQILQILVNLVRNAKYACDESEQPDRKIIVRVTQVGDRARVAVIDNGVGIAPENMTRIFNHGFTTRDGGHGFGLHSGALAARELNGSLDAHSEGPGLGAMFTLDLPVYQPDAGAGASLEQAALEVAHA